MNILALDLGTKTGWALRTRGGTVSGGTENFAPKAKELPGRRWLKFRAWLAGMGRSAGELHAVYFEDVKNHSGVLAAHVYGGFLATLQAWCEANRIPCHPVGVGQVKKHWTGKGNANKAQMIETAIAKGFRPVDENHADALAILSYAETQEGK